MALLHDAGVHQAPVRVQDRLREPGGSGGEIDRAVVIVRDIDAGRLGRAVLDQIEAVRKGGAVISHVEEVLDPRHSVEDRLHAACELRPEDQTVHIRQLQAVQDLLGVVAEVQRHHHGAGLQDAEVNGQPFNTVHQQDRHLGVPADPPGEQEVREAVRLDVELSPGDLLPERAAPVCFDEGILSPGDSRDPLRLRIDLHQGGLILEVGCVPAQQFCDRHDISLLCNRRSFSWRFFSGSFSAAAGADISSAL